MLMFEILKKYNLYDDVLSSNRFGSGLINRTQLIETKSHRYVLQIIENSIFENPIEVVENIKKVIKYTMNITDDHESPFNIELIRTTEGEKFPEVNGVYFRCYQIPKQLKIIMKTVNEKMIYELGKGIGNFHKSMNDFPLDTLNNTLPSLHNTKGLYDQLMDYVYETQIERAIPLFNEVKFIMDRNKDLSLINDLLENKIIPETISHNNIRPNNLLYNQNTYKLEAIFGFDAVKKGSRLYDFGDAVRFFASTTKEDEGNLDIVSLNLIYFRKFMKGYYEGVKDVITDEEIKYLVDSVKCMALEHGLLYLNNYLCSCPKVEYNEQNLDRVRNQFKLVKDIEKHYLDMIDIVKDVVRK